MNLKGIIFFFRKMFIVTEYAALTHAMLPSEGSRLGDPN